MDLQPSWKMGSEGFAMVQFGSDESLNVNFYTKSVINKRLSMESGRPMFDAAPFVRIQHPGEKDYTDREATDLDKHRFAKHWEQYCKNVQQIPDGTPIELLFPQNPEIASTLHSRGIHVVEQLAKITAHGIQEIGLGGQDWVTKAQQFLDKAKSGVNFHHLQAENDKLKNIVEDQAEKMRLMQSQLSQLMAERVNAPAKQMMALPQQADIEAAARTEYLAPLQVPASTISVASLSETENQFGDPLPRKGGRPKGSKNKAKPETLEN